MNSHSRRRPPPLFWTSPFGAVEIRLRRQRGPNEPASFPISAARQLEHFLKSLSHHYYSCSGALLFLFSPVSGTRRRCICMFSSVTRTCQFVCLWHALARFLWRALRQESDRKPSLAPPTRQAAETYPWSSSASPALEYVIELAPPERPRLVSSAGGHPSGPFQPAGGARARARARAPTGDNWPVRRPAGAGRAGGRKADTDAPAAT